MKNYVRNAEREAHENPAAVLLAAMSRGASESIEHSERQGQAQLVKSDVLPVNSWDKDDEFAALGFTFGPPVADDTIFREATIPAGWRRASSDHAMWSYIVDERGIKRVAIFYKAAHYDRSAHMRLVRPGRELATEALYGKTAPTAESMKLAFLTADEVVDLRAGLEEMRQNVARSPDIYGEHSANLAAADDIMARHHPT